VVADADGSPINGAWRGLVQGLTWAGVGEKNDH